MKLLVLLLVIAAANARLESITVNRNLVTRSYGVYESHNDIVNMVIPLNVRNFWDQQDKEYWRELVRGFNAFFFVEADDTNERIYKGLYLYRSNRISKVLDNGRDATAFSDYLSTKAYIAASDGIYVYDYRNRTVNKYGTLNDSIKQIEANDKTEVLYIVTDDNKIYSVSDEGTKKKKVLEDVKEIIFDLNGDLYYHDSKKDLYVSNQNGVKKIEGVPRGNIKLITPSFYLMSAFAIIDDVPYVLNNGTAKKTNVKFEIKPTAFAAESTILQFYALDKKIYSINAERIVLNHVTTFDDVYEASNYSELQMLVKSLEILSEGVV